VNSWRKCKKKNNHWTIVPYEIEGASTKINIRFWTINQTKRSVEDTEDFFLNVEKHHDLYCEINHTCTRNIFKPDSVWYSSLIRWECVKKAPRNNSCLVAKTTHVTEKQCEINTSFYIPTKVNGYMARWGTNTDDIMPPVYIYSCLATVTRALSQAT